MKKNKYGFKTQPVLIRKEKDACTCWCHSQKSVSEKADGVVHDTLCCDKMNGSLLVGGVLQLRDNWIQEGYNRGRTKCLEQHGYISKQILKEELEKSGLIRIPKRRITSQLTRIVKVEIEAERVGWNKAISHFQDLKDRLF